MAPTDGGTTSRWAVRSADGREVEVRAVDWMMAMVRATELLSIVPAGLHYAPAADGTVAVSDPEGGHSWTVIPHADDRAAGTPSFAPRAPTPMSAVERGGAMVPARRRSYRSAVRKPMWAPERVTGYAEPPPNLAERLLELSHEIRSQRDARAAATRALELALGLVTCEAGCVLRGGADDEELEFFVAIGGAGDALVGRRVPFHAGLAGACYDSGVTIRVDDAALDPRHLRQFDEETGFVTRSVLCVPVRSEHGFHGVVELLNPRSPFLPWHVDVVESLAAALAETVAGH